MSLEQFGRAVGQPSRAAMLQALMGGKALSATELAWHAGVTNQTATSHLNQLLQAGLLYRRKCGRFHYYELCGAEVAALLVHLACAAPVRTGRRNAVKSELKKARFCYDHLAGELGVEMANRLVKLGALTLDRDSFQLTETAHPVCRALGVELDAVRNSRRRLCPRCLDWTERLPHVAGALGAALAAKLVERRFIVRSRHDRSIAVTDCGRSFLRDALGFSPAFFAAATDAGKRQYRLAAGG